MAQYFPDVLHQPMSTPDVPDLQGMAQDYNVAATLGMCRLAITIAVQCENNNKAIIEKIQSLTESEQHSLMKVIEQTMAKVRASGDTSTGDASMTECVHWPSSLCAILSPRSETIITTTSNPSGAKS